MSQESTTPNTYDEFEKMLIENRQYWENEEDFKVELFNPSPINTIDMPDSIDLPGRFGNPFPPSTTKDWLPSSKTYVHPTAQIGEDVEIGEGTYIGPFCIIGYPAEHKAFWNKPVGKVIIGNNCVITGHVTIDAGTEHPTHIGNNVWMLKHSHVGHDATIGNDVTISCGAKVGGHCVVMDNSNLGLNCSIHQWVVIPSFSMIGMGAVVTKNTIKGQAGRKWAGVPAKDIGSNIIK